MTLLKRGLGFISVLALAITSIAGTGLFFGPAIAASISGNLSIIAWILVCLLSIYIASCFAELSSMYPRAGGVYEFAKHAYGKFPSFMIGWTAWIVTNVTTTLLIVAATDYLFPSTNLVYKIMISFVFILLLNVIAYFGIEASSTIMIGFAFMTITIILMIIFPSIFLIDFSRLAPVLSNPIPTIFLTVFFISETFFGWESVTFLAEETKNPRKIIPKALMYGTVGLSVLVMLLAVTILGNIPWASLAASATPLSFISSLMHNPVGAYITSIGIYIVLIGSAAGGIISAPRLLLALSRDKLFLSQFKEIHPKYQTPYKAIIFQTLVALFIIVVGFADYLTLLSLLVPMAFLMYIFVIMSVTVLRFKAPDTKREFKVLFPTVGPILASAFMIFTLIIWTAHSNNYTLLISSLGILALGIPVYMLLEMYYNPKTITLMHDITAYLMLWTENFFIPKHTRNEILYLLGDMKNKVVLEFGCSVGTFTKNLAEYVSNKGKVWAVDASGTRASITHKRMRHLGHNHVSVFNKDEDMHAQVNKVDAIVSIGALSYLQNPEEVLKKLSKKAKKGTKIIFIDYDKIFFFIPNVEWMTDNKIKEVFKKAGFKVVVIRRRARYWEQIMIYGKKM